MRYVACISRHTQARVCLPCLHIVQGRNPLSHMMIMRMLLCTHHVIAIIVTHAQSCAPVSLRSCPSHVLSLSLVLSSVPSPHARVCPHLQPHGPSVHYNHITSHHDVSYRNIYHARTMSIPSETHAAHMRTQTYTHTCTYAQTHMHTHMHVRRHIRTSIRTAHIHIHVHMIMCRCHPHVCVMR